VVLGNGSDGILGAEAVLRERPPRRRVGRVSITLGLVAVTLVTGFGIGALLWSGEAPSAASRAEAPASRPAVADYPVKLEVTWLVPEGTEVTFVHLANECAKNPTNVEFVTGAPPFRKTETVFVASTSGRCHISWSWARFLVVAGDRVREITVQQYDPGASGYYVECNSGDLPCAEVVPKTIVSFGP
jgi:hypothetical protein